MPDDKRLRSAGQKDPEVDLASARRRHDAFGDSREQDKIVLSFLLRCRPVGAGEEKRKSVCATAFSQENPANLTSSERRQTEGARAREKVEAWRVLRRLTTVSNVC